MRPFGSAEARNPNRLRSFWLKSPAGNRAKQRCCDRVYRPTIVEPFCKVLRNARTTSGNLSGDDGSYFVRLGVRALCRDGTADKFDDLVDRRDDRHIRKATLDLAPFVLDALAETIRISLESLVQYADDDQLSVATIGGLCEVLEEMNVDGVIGSTFQVFAKLVDNDEYAALGTGFDLALQALDDIAPVGSFRLRPLGPSAARVATDR